MAKEETIDLYISYKNRKLLAFVSSSLVIFLIGEFMKIKTLTMIGEILCCMSIFVIFVGMILLVFHKLAYGEDENYV